jgi:hypothetical protein
MPCKRSLAQYINRRTGFAGPNRSAKRLPVGGDNHLCKPAIYQ